MNPVQLLIVIAMLVVGAGMIWYGVAWCRVVWSKRQPGEPFHGRGLGIAIGGLAIALLGADIAIQITNGWAGSPIARWWFLPPGPLGNGFLAALASPIMALSSVAILTFFLGLPSWTQLKAIGRLFASPRTRGQAILAALGGVAWLVLSVGAALATYSATESRFLGLIVFGIVAWGLLGLGLAVGVAAGNRPRKEKGE